MKKVLSGLILVFLVGIRFLFLDRFPVGMSHDELEYVLSGKSYFLTGADLSGSHFPESIFQTRTEGIISFLPALLLSPYFGLVPMNQFTVRLPYVFISLMTGVCLYLLVKKIFKNNFLAWLALIIYLINPWSFYLSRVAADTAFCLLFYLLGTLFLVDDFKKKRWWSLIFFILGFLSYHGAKVVFLPLIMVGLIYNLLKKRIKIREGLLFLVISSLLMISYFVIGGKFFNESVNQTRTDDIWIFNQQLLSNVVDEGRKASLEGLGGKIFLNKMTVVGKIFFQKYLSAFSPEVLFISGDAMGAYRFGEFGLFYLIDFVFLFLGLINLYKEKPKEAWFLLLLALVSPLATALSGVETSIVNRSFLLLPVLVIFIAFGILSIYENLPKNRIKIIFSVILIMIYLMFFGGFLDFYFYRFPVLGQENYFFSQKIMASYINRSAGSKIVVIGNEPRELFLETVFFDGNNQSERLKNFVNSQKVNLDNIEYISECPKSFEDDTVYIVEKTFNKCLPDKENLRSINEEQFGGPLYYIKNDSLCLSFELQSWLRFRYTKDYAIEKLDDKDFCQTWIRN